jgi:hypothetical protein
MAERRELTMDSRWFKEDRELARKDKEFTEAELKAQSKTALKNSTLFQRRLGSILDDLIEESNRDDEDFSKPGWEREHVANISRRKALREIKKLIQL